MIGNEWMDLFDPVKLYLKIKLYLESFEAKLRHRDKSWRSRTCSIRSRAVLMSTFSGKHWQEENRRVRLSRGEEEKHLCAWSHFYLLLLQVEGQSLKSDAVPSAPLVAKH